ncbi:MAG: hypothetical protein H7323_09135, partial [Frankiales bacterium]|nr:hypothetical protein [Frankiales bacterium]
ALLASLVTAAWAVGILLDDRAVDQRGSVTEGVVAQVRDRLWRDQVVVSLDQLDGRPIVVTQDGPVRVGQRLQVEYDPDGPAVGRVAGSDRDRGDGQRLLTGAAIVLVLVGAGIPWRRRRAASPR